MNDMPRIAMARIEQVGDRQVIHLPEGYNFATTEVRITVAGDHVVLEEPEDGVDAETGLPVARLRELIQEGIDSGPGEPLDMDDIKQRGRARLAAGARR